MSKVTLHFTRGRDRQASYGRKDEEYMADFVLIAKRTLTPELYKLFRFHFLLGADWRLCTRKLEMDRGSFFHAVYRIQQQLGRVFCELEPYGLFPLDEYFSTVVTSSAPTPISSHQRHAGNLPVRPPLNMAA